MKVLLTAPSAKNIHKTLAPWCLKAYCDIHVPACQVLVQEHTVNDHLGDVAAELFQSNPDVVGFSCYIWNIEFISKLAGTLKKYLPNCLIVLGGPEVSFEADCSAYPVADYIVQGPGEHAFADLLKKIMAGDSTPGEVTPSGHALDLNALPSPYTPAYFDSFKEGRMRAIANQLIYYESTRGCPFSCSYCLSSTICGVQELALQRVFSDIDNFLKHGATCVKFVDRTFNANRGRALEILRYILPLKTDCTFHFEVAADLFDAKLLQLISAMPPERVQFEIGIQSTHDKTLTEINRRMDVAHALQNIQTLVSFGNCHIHVDLIAGLPFDTPHTFAQSIDACIDRRPHMLQLGFLKLLKGTKIRARSGEYGCVCNAFAPYEILRSRDMDFADIIKLKQIEHTLDKFYNSGMFANSVEYAIKHVFHSAYACFEELSAFCKGENPRVSLKRAYTMLLHFLYEHIEKPRAQHYIKLDCFTFNSQGGVLPDEIPAQRDKTAEHDFKRNTAPQHSNVRAEFFEYDRKTRLFIYDEKDEIRKSYKHVILP